MFLLLDGGGAIQVGGDVHRGQGVGRWLGGHQTQSDAALRSKRRPDSLPPFVLGSAAASRQLGKGVPRGKLRVQDGGRELDGHSVPT